MNKLAVAALVFAAAAAHAAPAAAPAAHPDIPEALRPWQAWVLHGKEDDLCPFLNGVENETRCAWPSSLQLDFGDKGGRFTQKWRTWKKSWVALPGDDKAWPQDVRVDGKPAVVATPKDGDESASPKVLLPTGEHTVTGTFTWDELPESVAVPPATGLLALTVRGAKLISPGRDDEGRLLLGKGATKVEADVLDMTVHRAITDSIPLVLTTRIQLRVSGRGREVVLGRSLPDGFVPMSLESKIPARLEPDSRLRVQVRPGTWQITMVARHDGPVTSLKRPAADGEWAPEEVWVFDARPDLRLVTVEGVAAIDPQQTTLPDEWKRLPCYPMKPEDTLALVEHRRGDADPAPDRLSLHRELWLDYDGGGYTASDQISGNLNRAWRLEVDSATELGRVSVGGKDQFITRSGKGGLAGVEVRQGVVDVSADSRIPGHIGELPAVSWASDFHQVDGTLHLPPGWRLLHASGADEVPGTWIRHWSLLDLFLVLIIAMAVGRLFGMRWGVLALATLVLVFPEEEAPRWMFLALLAFEALIRALKNHEGRLLTFLKWLRLGSRVLLALFAVMFATEQVRAGVYPALEHSNRHGGGGYFPLLGATAAPMDQAETAPTSLAINLPKGAPAVAMDGEATEPALAPPPPKEQAASRRLIDKMDKDESKESTLSLLGSRGAATGGYKSQTWQYANEYDPSAMVQTGPGLPRWTWNDVALRFNGPVQREQHVRLWLVPPRANLILAGVRVVLLALLVIVLLGLPDERLPKFLRRRGAGAAAAIVIAILSSVALPRAARADVPPQPVLDELQKRLLEKPECWPSCASSPRLVLEIAPRRLRARMEVGAAADTAVPLPGGAKQWVPEQVLLDGKPAPALLHADDGTLWLQVPAGSHQVILDGALPERDTVQIALPLKSHRVEAHADGWQLEGLHEDGHADDDLQLTRVRENRREGVGSLQSGALPPFVRVEREVHVGLLWQVDTRVVRVTPTGSAVVLEVPLLPGESVTTPEVRVQNGKALVNMAPSATEVVWHSLLQERPPLLLEAPRALPWTEVWRLDVSPIWHVELSGIPVVHRQNGAGLNRPEWQPWPGERVRIDVAKPEGIAGRTLTIDRSVLTLKPGLRATDATLNISLRSSRGGQHVVTLPEGAVLQQVTVDGRTQPLRQDKRAVTLPLLPGSQTVELSWRQPDPVGFRFATPSIDLGAPSVNAEQYIQLSDDRWVLFVSGPRMGPAVLFWSFLLVIALVSILLGRLTWTPLRAHHWLLLGLGLSQVPIESAAIVAGWLLLLGWRRRSPSTTRWRFNLRQLFLVGWTLVALIILVVSIRGGLLGEPEMQISGNGSFAGSLRWFQDRAESTLPRAQVASVPLWAYRVAMLMWALWLAGAMLKWLRWGWGSFSLGGVWQKSPPKPPKPAPPSAPNTPNAPNAPNAPNSPNAPSTATPPTAAAPTAAAPGAPTADAPTTPGEPPTT